MQRFLQTHEQEGDEGKSYDPGENPGFINLYARRMADDPDVLVNGAPDGKRGLFTTLGETKVDGAAVKDELVESIMGSSAWRSLGNANLKKSLADHVHAEGENGLGPAPAEYKSIDEYLQDIAGDYLDSVREWVVQRLAKLDEATTVGEVKAVDVPIEWHTDMAEIVYAETRGEYLGKQVNAQPYLPPFKAMIADVNNGEIDGFRYVRKYGQGNAPGAEFEVSEPQEKREQYEGKAVLHTHYAEEDEEPNYAHTKPFPQRYALGYGYTVVDLNRVKAVDDTRKSFDEL